MGIAFEFEREVFDKRQSNVISSIHLGGSSNRRESVLLAQQEFDLDRQHMPWRLVTTNGEIISMDI